jgi:cysteine desulfurase / selenocysteine lyase
MIEQKYMDEYAYMKGRIYMDCSRMGMQPERTLKAAREYLDDFAYHLGKMKCNSTQIRKTAKDRIGELINTNPEDIYFTMNTTQGNNLLTYGYPFGQGDEVIVGNGDFPAVWMPWAGKQRDGVKLVWVDNKNGIVSADEFIKKITDKTKAIAISLAQSSSGYVVDIATLGKVCRGKNIILSVDAVQALGRIPVDVEKAQIDILASSSSKGLVGVMGAGFCYCRKEIMQKITPPCCSDNTKWENMDFAPGFTQMAIPEFADGAERMEAGTGNIYGYLVMSESIGLLLEIGIDNIAEKIRGLELYYRNRIKESKLDVTMLGSEDEATWGGSISFRLPQEYRAALSAEIEKEKISATVHTSFLVGLHYYNTKEQIDRLMVVLNKVLPHKNDGSWKNQQE